MTMQQGQGTVWIVSAEEHQQLCFPAWDWLPPLYQCWKKMLWSLALFTGGK